MRQEPETGASYGSQYVFSRALLQAANMNTGHDLQDRLLIPCRASPTLLIASIVLHAGGVIALLLAQVPGWAAAGAGVLIVLHGCAVHGRLGPNSPTTRLSLELDVRSEWQLLDENGKRIPLEPRGRPFVHPLLIVLEFRTGSGSRHEFILLPDNTDAEILRRLRVRLRSGNPG